MPEVGRSTDAMRVLGETIWHKMANAAFVHILFENQRCSFWQMAKTILCRCHTVSFRTSCSLPPFQAAVPQDAKHQAADLRDERLIKLRAMDKMCWTQADKMVWIGCGDRLPAGIIPAPPQLQDKPPAPHQSSSVSCVATVGSFPVAAGSHLQSSATSAAMLADALQVWSSIPT